MAYGCRKCGNGMMLIMSVFLDALASLELVISVGGEFFREILPTGQKVKQTYRQQDNRTTGQQDNRTTGQLVNRIMGQQDNGTKYIGTAE